MPRRSGPEYYDDDMYVPADRDRRRRSRHERVIDDDRYDRRRFRGPVDELDGLRIRDRSPERGRRGGERDMDREELDLRERDRDRRKYADRTSDDGFTARRESRAWAAAPGAYDSDEDESPFREDRRRRKGARSLAHEREYDEWDAGSRVSSRDDRRDDLAREWGGGRDHIAEAPSPPRSRYGSDLDEVRSWKGDGRREHRRDRRRDWDADEIPIRQPRRPSPADDAWSQETKRDDGSSFLPGLAATDSLDYGFARPASPDSRRLSNDWHDRGETIRSPRDDMREWQPVEDPPSPRTKLSPNGGWRPGDASVSSSRRPRSPDRERAFASEWDDDRKDVPHRSEGDTRRRSMEPRPSDTHKSVTEEWAFVDSPPYRREIRDERPIRELQDEIGSPSHDSRSRPYSMERRPRFSDEPPEVGERERRGRRIGPERKRKSKWTEITKDLMVREAIERSGYEFEETELFYCVFAHLEYVSCLSSAELALT